MKSGDLGCWTLWMLQRSRGICCFSFDQCRAGSGYLPTCLPAYVRISAAFIRVIDTNNAAACSRIMLQCCNAGMQLVRKLQRD